MTVKRNSQIESIVLITLLFLLLSLIIGCTAEESRGINASGSVEAVETDINTETGGRIIDISVKEGTTVRKGDIVANIDATIQELKVKQAEAGFTAALERAKETKSGSREQMIAQAQSTVNQVNSLLQGAKQTMENARENLARIRELYDQGGATSQQLSDSQTRFENAKAQYESYGSQKTSAQEQLDLLKSGATEETINISDAAVKQAQASLEMARENLAKTVLRAPLDGMVSSVNFRAGEVISPGAAIVTVINNKDLWIKIYVTEKEIPKIIPGQKAEITIDAYPDKVFPGEVSFISPKAEFTPKNLQTKEERVNMVFAVKIRIPDGEEILKPGLPADVKIMTRQGG